MQDLMQLRRQLNEKDSQMDKLDKKLQQNEKSLALQKINQQR